MSSTPIIWCPLAVSPIASVNAPLFFSFSLFFPRSRVGMDLVSSHTTLDNFSLWRRFSSKTSEWVCRPVSRRQFDPFPDGNLFSLPFLTSCYVPPNSSTNGTNWICFSIFFSLSFPLFIEITSFFFFFLKIEICGFPPQNAIAFISFPFFCETGKIPIICKMWARLPASFYTRYTGLCWMQQKSAPMRIGKPV